MPDREKVIKGLEQCIETECQDCPYDIQGSIGLRCMDNLMGDALALLREQEPVKPKKWTPNGQLRGYFCQSCDSSMSYGDRFCHWCGRAVKWDD